MCGSCEDEAFNDGVAQGREEMLADVLSQAAGFRDKLRKRRYTNNANGVQRFIDYLKEEK